MRSIFRLCYNRFRQLAEKEKRFTRASLELSPRGGGRITWGRKDEEYVADFLLVTRRTLTEAEYQLFSWHFLLGADWKLCTRRLNVDRGDFFHAVYRIQQRLGRTFRDLQPYPLYPLEDYFENSRPHEDGLFLPPQPGAQGVSPCVPKVVPIRNNPRRLLPRCGAQPDAARMNGAADGRGPAPLDLQSAFRESGVMKRLLILLTVFALSAVAADISGTWKATAEGPNGSMERTFVFKVDGGKLTGETTSSMMGKSVIENGKVDGDNVTFTITVKFQDNEMKVNYKGKVTGNEVKFTAEVADQTITWVGKRVQ